VAWRARRDSNPQPSDPYIPVQASGPVQDSPRPRSRPSWLSRRVQIIRRLFIRAAPSGSLCWHPQWFSRAFVIHCPPLLLPGLSAYPPAAPSKIIPRISRVASDGPFAPTSGAAGRLPAALAIAGRGRSLVLAVVRGRCCTLLLYRLADCLIAHWSTPRCARFRLAERPFSRPGEVPSCCAVYERTVLPRLAGASRCLPGLLSQMLSVTAHSQAGKDA
jgi:hypothetical protein